MLERQKSHALRKTNGQEKVTSKTMDLYTRLESPEAGKVFTNMKEFQEDEINDIDDEG